MSRFEAAAKKAAGAAPKPAAKSASVGSVSAKVKPKPAPKLDTLDDKKKFVKQQEMKISDKEDAIKEETNKSKQRDLQNELKKLQTDEYYIQAKEGIKEAEAQAKRDEERAALNEKAPADAKKAQGKAAAKAKAGAGADTALQVVANEATMAEIDAAFAGSGKDAAVAKAGAIEKLQALAAWSPFVIPRLDKLIGLFADSKLGTPAVKASVAIVDAIQPKGHGIADAVLPALMLGMEDKRWKVKAGCIEVLGPCVRQMAAATKGQLSECLPQIVAKLAEAALEVRKEIRTATDGVMREIGSIVASPEIQKLSQDLVTALVEPTNQKHTQSVLARMGNQTFMSLIDAASLSLLMPIVVRGLREREPASKKWSAQIFGSTSQLVADVEFIKPYLKSVVPMLQDALTDPVAEVQREAAKAFGVLEAVLPAYSRSYCQPWLFGKLNGGEPGEQVGAALGMAEVLLKMDKSKADELIPEILIGATNGHGKSIAKKGFLELMDTLPQAMKMDFVPYIDQLFPPMLMGITGEKDQVDDPGHRAALALVQRFGDLCPELLLPAFEGCFAATLNANSPEESVRQQIIREKSTALLLKTAEKILEHKKFGQDLLTTEDCSTKETRERLLCLVMAIRYDPDAAVKRIANLVWKTAGGAPKLQKAIMPSVEKLLLRMRRGELGAGAQKLAGEIIDDLVKSGDMEAPEGDVPESEKLIFPTLPADATRAQGVTAMVSGAVVADATELAAAEGGTAQGRDRAASSAQELLTTSAEFASLPADVQNYCGLIVRSIVQEGKKRKLRGPTLTLELTDGLRELIGHLASVDTETYAKLQERLPDLSEAAVRAAMGDTYDAGADDNNDGSETLLRVESLLLMYGAGHLLLRDTMLEMKKNQRYGVVGQNGAGKTTLMKEIASHRIVGMPDWLKCVHVDDSKLGEMSKSTLTCLEYCIKKAKEIGVHDAGRETLIKVGFAEKMLDEQVSEMSTGWRMRLTLAVSMLKHADLVLLDEPTNHLDEESVEWLSDYILSITSSSVMVISHEPKFLNKVCTHIIAYVDKKLEYTDGNFDVFAAQKGLSKEQIEAMLSGNLSFDTEAAEDGEGGGDGKDGSAAPKVSAPVSGPPKLAFPIPGSCEGVKTGSKSVLELKKVSFRYSKDKDYLISDCTAKLSLNSRVAICGRNGCGKSTLMTLLCSELSPSENKDENLGEVWRHHNVRLAYMKQDHLKALGPFFDTSPFVYITERFKDGFDGDLQRRLIEPEDEEEAERRKKLAKEYGKYGNEVEDLVSRNKIGSTLHYEVKWKGLDDPKQNTMEPITKLKNMGLDKVVIACDERIAAKAAQLDQRPLTRREIVRHVEAFGIDEEMCCNRQIRGFSAGQKVRLSMAAMFWTKPHLIALDEPTNYLDVETVEALVKALNTFRGGIVMIEPKTDFVERICNEKWNLEDGVVTVEKMKNNNKRQA